MNTIYLFTRDTNRTYNGKPVVECWPRSNDKITEAVINWINFGVFQKRLNKNQIKPVEIQNQFDSLYIEGYDTRYNSSSDSVLKVLFFVKELDSFVKVDLRLDDFTDLLHKYNSIKGDMRGEFRFYFKAGQNYRITWAGSPEAKEYDRILAAQKAPKPPKPKVTLEVGQVYKHTWHDELIYLGRYKHQGKKGYVFGEYIETTNWSYYNPKYVTTIRKNLLFFSSKPNVSKITTKNPYKDFINAWGGNLPLLRFTDYSVLDYLEKEDLEA